MLRRINLLPFYSNGPRTEEMFFFFYEDTPSKFVQEGSFFFIAINSCVDYVNHIELNSHLLSFVSRSPFSQIFKALCISVCPSDESFHMQSSHLSETIIAQESSPWRLWKDQSVKVKSFDFISQGNWASEMMKSWAETRLERLSSVGTWAKLHRSLRIAFYSFSSLVVFDTTLELPNFAWWRRHGFIATETSTFPHHQLYWLSINN